MPASELLIPVRWCARSEGSFTWPATVRLASPSREDLLPLRQLARDLQSCKLRTRLCRNAFGPAEVRIARSREITGRDAYRLTIAPEGITIRSADAPGAYYAVQTLRDLLAIHGRQLPACRIDDRPDFARRGVYHDCSRGKVPTVKTLKALVERLAHWKINELQLYIENVFTFRRHPAIGRGFSPFKPQQLLALQDHCKAHHVRLVGSLASFGHMERILQLPAYRELGELPGHNGWPGGTTLCPTDPRSIRLLGELYEEFAPLFEADDFNLCGDEPWELGKGRSKDRAEAIGVGRLYTEFLGKVIGLCGAHGKRANAWADIVLEHPDTLADLPEGTVMLNWDYHQDCTRMARSGEIVDAHLPLVVCPGTSAWNSHGSRMNNAVKNVAKTAAIGRQHQAEGLVTTDWGDNGHRNLLGASLHGFAHGAAHAWNGRSVDDAGFTERFCRLTFPRSHARLADALRTLGRTEEMIDRAGMNHNPLYFWLTRPLAADADADALADLDIPVAGLRRVVDELADPDLWPAAPPTLDAFETLALRELALAARMDVLAARRALLARDLHAGQRPPASQTRALSADLCTLADDFQRLWLERNRPSRLRDNLSALARSADDVLQAGGG